jgi:endonuclease I
MTSSFPLRDIAFFVLAALLAIPLPAQAQSSVPIAEARDQGVGATVTVEGTVTRAYGSYARLQDESGATGTSALMIRQTDGAQSEAFQNAIENGDIQPGTRLRVTGTLSTFYGLLQVNGDDLESFEVLSQGDVPAAQEVTLTDLIWDGEDYESELVRVKALRLPEASGSFEEGNYDAVGPSGATVTLRVQRSDETALGGTEAPGEAFTYTGVVGQFNQSGPGQVLPNIGYQLIPVRPGDLDTGAQSVALRGGYALAYETDGDASAEVRVSAFGLEEAREVTVSASDSGTASAGDVSDLGGGGQTLTLSGDGTKTLSLTAESDGDVEGIERLELDLSSSDDADLVEGGRFTLWILDDPTAQATLYPDLDGAALRRQLREDFATDADGQPGPPTLGYDRARDSLYATVFNDGGTVRGFYTGLEASVPESADDASEAAGDDDLNTEHLWPRSEGPEFEPSLSNLHILAPAWSEANSARCNYPYAEIDDSSTEQWYGADGSEGISQSDAPGEPERDEYSEALGASCGGGGPEDGGRFEPREGREGNAARKALYFRLAYPDRVSDFDFFETQLGALQAWNEQDPVTAAEQRRNVRIASSQGDQLNPFQLDSSLAERAFSDITDGGGGGPGEVVPIAEARAQSDGTRVTVEGVFTRIEGSNARIQDPSGPTGASGIVVRSDTLEMSIEDGEVETGDRLRATGTLDSYANLKQINAGQGPLSFEIVEEDAGLPDAQNVSVAQFAENGEDYESELVRVEGLTIDPGGDDTFAAGGAEGNYPVTGPNGNTVTLRIPGGSFYGGEPIPEGEVTFEGVAGQFSFDDPDSGYQLLAIEEGALTSGDDGGGDETLSVDLSRSFGNPDQPGGYRLVALPGDVDRPLAETIDGTAGDAWQAYWDDGSEEDFFVPWSEEDETFDFRPGRGFWLISEDPWTVSAEIPAVALGEDGTYAIALHEGWNIISNPLARSVDWGAVESANGDVTLQPLWRFSGSFSREDESFPSATGGEAFYFLNSEGLDELVLPASDAPAAAQAARGEDTQGREQTLVLTTYRDGQRTSAARVGTAPGATDALDAHDVYAPPARFAGASLRLPLPSSAASSQGERPRRLAGERRAPGQEGYAFDLVLNAAPGEGAVTVRAGGLADAFDGQPVRLVEAGTGDAHDLRAKRSVEITPGQSGETRLRVLVGQAVGEAAGLPEKVTLGAGYPNPFRDEVTLEYALPEEKKVHVAVYDLLGRRVRTLADGRREAGSHTITWEGRSHGGEPLASGVYFVRMRAGDVTRSAKLVRVQ